MYYIGIDVAKHHHDAIGLDEAGQVVIPPFRFANTQRGVNELLDRLHRLDGSIRIALESTGHYWLALYEHLLKHGLSVAVLNPIQVKAYRQVGIRKTKTDPLDSFWIADFLRIGRAQPMAVPSPNIRQMRELARFRFTLLDRRADIQRRALAILDRVFPEYHTLFSRPFGPTSRHLLRRAVTAHEFAAWPLQGLTEAIRKASRGRLGHSLARRIHTAAQHSLLHLLPGEGRSG
jgi:transposase